MAEFADYMFKTIDEDLVRLDRTTDDTAERRKKLLSKMEPALDHLKLAGDGVKDEDVELSVKVINAYVKVLDSIDGQAAKRALVKLKKGEVDRADDANKQVGEFLKRLQPGMAVYPDPANIVTPQQAAEQMEGRLSEAGLDIPDTALRQDPNDLS